MYCSNDCINETVSELIKQFVLEVVSKRIDVTNIKLLSVGDLINES
jgi:hypothetical protein